MNYYRRYSGDYLRDTARLSMLEHGAYCLMLDYYYSEEQPLPLDLNEIYTMVRAMTPADRKAVDKVLAKYFTPLDDGYHNERANHEIEVSQKARGNGGKGGRPPKTITGCETGIETGCITELETEIVTGEGGGSGHPPTTNHQPPASSLQPPSRKTLSGKPDDAKQVLEFLNQKTGRRYQPVKANLEMIVARLKEGTTVDELRMVVAKKCREWAGDEKMSLYLRPKTLFSRLNYAQYQGELVNPGSQDAVS